MSDPEWRESVLRRVQTLGLTDDKRFEAVARDASRIGPSAIPELMIAARDGESLFAQLCAIKAIGMIGGDKADEARRRIAALDLPAERGRVVRGAYPHPPAAFSRRWNVLDVLNTLLQNDPEAAAEEKRLGRRETVVLKDPVMANSRYAQQHVARGRCTLPLCIQCRPTDRDAGLALFRERHADSIERDKAWARAHPPPLTIGYTTMGIVSLLPATLLIPVQGQIDLADWMYRITVGMVVLASVLLLASCRHAGGRGSTAVFRPPSRRTFAAAGLLSSAVDPGLHAYLDVSSALQSRSPFDALHARQAIEARSMPASSPRDSGTMCSTSTPGPRHIQHMSASRSRTRSRRGARHSSCPHRAPQRAVRETDVRDGTVGPLIVGSGPALHRAASDSRASGRRGW